MGTRMTEIQINIPEHHKLAKNFWYDQMINFCTSNNYAFLYSILPEPSAGIIFNFTEKSDASHFALRWIDSDWGMMWHPC